MASTSLYETWRRAHQSQIEEADGILRPLEGQVPSDLRGSYYRIGPGRLARGGDRYAHPFDGDGMVARFTFVTAGIRYRNRHVRTREYRAEEAAGRMLFRSFGTNLPGGFLRNALRTEFKNAANTALVHHGRKLLALWEGGLPHRLEAETLDTIDRHHFGGRLIEPSPWPLRGSIRELPFSAHPKVDPVTGELFNFGTQPGIRSRLLLYRIRPDGEMDPPATLALDRLYFIHDFALTARYRVFFLSPVAFGVGRMVTGLDTPVGSMSSAGGLRGRVLVVPRGGGAPFSIAGATGFVFHVANGYEDGPDRIVVDATRWPEFPQFSDLRGGPGGRVYQGDGPTLTRFTIDLGDKRVQERPLAPYSAEFPVVSPDRVARRHQVIWCSGAAPSFDQPGAAAVVRIDLASGQTTLRSFAPDLPGEPRFVPRPGAAEEDDGWIVLTVYVGSEHRTDLVVLDARDLRVVCRARLPHHLPPAFHGAWIPALDGGKFPS